MVVFLRQMGILFFKTLFIFFVILYSMGNEEEIKKLKTEIESLQACLRFKEQITDIYGILNKKEINDKIQDNKITLLEKDISILSKGQAEIKECTKILDSKIDAIDKKQSNLSLVVENTHDVMSNFIDSHKDDAKDAIRWMKHIMWCVITVGTLLGGSIASFIAYQNKVIHDTMQKNIEIIEERKLR